MHDGAGYTVMEYVGGESLKEILQQRREDNNGVIAPMPVDQALAYVLAILPAFAYLHDHNLLFCDFKPENVIQQGDGVKLIDLGGVRRTDDLTSAIFGTVGYQAPEVAEVGPSVASDIYTIGRTLATLVLDFRGNTTTYVASLPPVADTPVFQQYDSFYRLLAKACALDPADRFATADEMRTQLLGVLREVVAADAGPGNPALHSAASVLFEAPVADVASRPLAWDELPTLRRDDHDPMASWLAGVNVVDPDARLAALADAPEDTVEVRLARARAAIEAERFDVLRDTIATILADDPWEWRAAWIGGLGELAQGDPVAARASFNAVYGQVPGELAPKLALAAACELSGEPDIAESLYVICARTDANYTAPAAFGLMRVREARGDLDGALHALDLVGPTRGSYVESRTLRAHLLAASGRGLPALADAMASVSTVAIAPRERAELAVGVLRSALDTVTASGPEPTTRIAGVPADEPALRDALRGRVPRARVAHRLTGRAHHARGPRERGAPVDDPMSDSPAPTPGGTVAEPSGVLECPACGEPSPEGARFCEACGTPLAPLPASPAPDAGTGPAADPATDAATDPAAAGTTGSGPGSGDGTGDEPDEPSGGPSAETGDITAETGARPCVRCGGRVAEDGYCTECGEPAASERDHWAERPASWVAGVCDRGVRHSRNEDAMALAASESATAERAFAALVVRRRLLRARLRRREPRRGPRRARRARGARPDGPTRDRRGLGAHGRVVRAPRRRVARRAGRDPRDRGHDGRPREPAVVHVRRGRPRRAARRGGLGGRLARLLDPGRRRRAPAQRRRLVGAGDDRARRPARPGGDVAAGARHHALARPRRPRPGGPHGRDAARPRRLAARVLGRPVELLLPAPDLAALVRSTQDRVGDDPQTLAGALVDWANAQGGRDNITATLARFSRASSTAPPPPPRRTPPPPDAHRASGPDDPIACTNTRTTEGAPWPSSPPRSTRTSSCPRARRTSTRSSP